MLYYSKQEVLRRMDTPPLHWHRTNTGSTSRGVGVQMGSDWSYVLKLLKSQFTQQSEAQSHGPYIHK